MKKINFAVLGAATLMLAACGGSEEAANNMADNSYDENAMNMDEATDNLANEMDALNEQSADIAAEADAIDTGDVQVDEAEGGAAGM